MVDEAGEVDKSQMVANSQVRMTKFSQQPGCFENERQCQLLGPQDSRNKVEMSWEQKATPRSHTEGLEPQSVHSMVGRDAGPEIVQQDDQIRLPFFKHHWNNTVEDARTRWRQEEHGEGCHIYVRESWNRIEVIVVM